MGSPCIAERPPPRPANHVRGRRAALVAARVLARAGLGRPRAALHRDALGWCGCSPPDWGSHASMGSDSGETVNKQCSIADFSCI